MKIAVGAGSFGIGWSGQRNRDGSTAGRVSITGSTEQERALARARARAEERAKEAKKAREAKRAKEARSRQEFKKKVNYHFKQISNRILQAKTSFNARRVMSSARQKVVELRKKLTLSNYNNQELLNAIRHAEAIARVAKKKWKHLLEEENVSLRGGICEAEFDEEEQDEAQESREDTESWHGEAPGMEAAAAPALDIEDIQELMEIYQELMQEALEDMEGLDELEDMMSGVQGVEMDPEDFKLMKAKHRSEELRKIMEADMKYLRAMFEKMAKDQQGGAGGVGNAGAGDAGREGAGYPGGVALELGGVEIPVGAYVMSAAEVVEGGMINTLA